MTDSEELTHYVRTYWLDGLEGVTELNNRVVYPTKFNALIAAMSRINVLGVPDTFRMTQEFDIVDCVNVIHIEWRTGGESKLRWVQKDG